MIVNTCGWDTDCNSGNVGCLLGIKNGLAGLATGPDFRGPIADRMYLPTADGGRAISDAVTETYHVVNVGRALAGEGPTGAPSKAPVFILSCPALFKASSPKRAAKCAVRLPWKMSPVIVRAGTRSLALRYRGVTTGRSARVATPTFIPSREIADYFSQRGYALMASPTLYPGQTVRAAVAADGQNAKPVTCTLYLHSYGAEDKLVMQRGPVVTLAAGERQEMCWPIADLDGAPIANIGVEISSAQRSDGVLYLDYLTWDGTPTVTFKRPDYVVDADRRTANGLSSNMWRLAWVNGLDQYDWWWPEAYRLVQNEGRGLLMQGTRDWQDYRAEAAMTIHLAKQAGLARARPGDAALLRLAPVC